MIGKRLETLTIETPLSDHTIVKKKKKSKKTINKQA